MNKTKQTYILVEKGIAKTIQSKTKPSISLMYRQVSNISRTLVGNENVDHSDVVGASPVGAAPTTSSFST